jgi:hypothetical protein
VTRSFDPAHPGFTDGPFRQADHVLVVPQGSAIAILDLERGVVYATTPYGAESWSTLVGGAKPLLRAVAETQSGPDDDEGSDARPRIAGYLLDRRIIDPVAGGADIR